MDASGAADPRTTGDSEDAVGEAEPEGSKAAKSDADMSVTEELLSESDGDGEGITHDTPPPGSGLEARGQRLVATMSAQVDRELATIRADSTSQVGEITKKVQQELQKQVALTAKLSAKVSENQTQTERVRLQVVELGHRADTRHAEITKQSSELTKPVKTMQTGGATVGSSTHAPPRAAPGGASQASGSSADRSDPRRKPTLMSPGSWSKSDSRL